jgi:hypothetical protein
MRYESVRKPKACPKCGSTSIAEILCGKPTIATQLMVEKAEGKFVFGGCSVSRDDPSWQCVACKIKIYSIR